MKILEDIKYCNGCHACFSICPRSCITMLTDGEGFLYPAIDDKKCVDCGTCKKSCLINKSHIGRAIGTGTPIFFAVVNKNEQIRMNSSSGGFFTLLAEDVITLGGVVFGAKFDNDFSVVHDYTETIEGLAAFRGSKYVQSKIGNSYKDVKKFLDEGKNVLFTGTPCQIGGLKAFLNKEYEKLICIDIICHGVPSPKVWRKYVEFRENVAKSKAEKIIFRLKNCGWTRYSVFFGFANKTEYCKIFNNDLFMQVFLKDLCLRKSCHRCGFKTISRISDITIADFWGAQSIVPEMFDDKGISLVLVQSPKGRDIFNKIKLGTDFIEIDSEKALLFNPAAFRSCAEPLKRSEFMIDIDNLSFDKLVKKYTKVSLIKRAIFFVSLVLKKISKTMFKSDKK